MGGGSIDMWVVGGLTLGGGWIDMWVVGGLPCGWMD